MSMTDGTPDQGPRAGGSAGANLAAIKDRVGKAGSAFDRKQRNMMALVFVGTIGAVLAFSFLNSRTNWSPLMTDLTADDASAVTKQLGSLGVEYQLADGGATVEVPSDVVYQTRIDIAEVEMPSSGKVGYGILDSQDLTTSEFGQRVGYQRAMEGELAKTIEAIDGVRAATVHLALPKNDTFALDEQKASASVMVMTGKNKVLASRQVQAIVNLVASGIEGMSSDDVSVADGEGNLLAAPGQDLSGSGSSDTTEMQTKYENGLASSIEEMLGTMVGAGKAKVTVSADLDFDSTESVSETYAPPSTLVPGQSLAVNENVKTETYSGAGAANAAEGVLGPDGLPLAAASTAGSGYELAESQKNNAVNKVVENTRKAPGAVKRLSVAVIVDEEAVTAAQLPELQTLVSAAAGIEADRGDTIAVSRFKLDTKAQEAMAEELAFRDKAVEETPGGIPVWAYGAGGVALVVLALFMLKMRKRSKRDDGVHPLELGSGPIPTDSIITLETKPRQTSASAVDGPSDVLASAGADAGIGAGAARGTAPGVERREALGDLIDNQPDEVAQLLRSWLGDRREVAR